ncbi:hypothetical protein Tco_0648477 [Tanacetum coccineum]
MKWGRGRKIERKKWNEGKRIKKKRENRLRRGERDGVGKMEGEGKEGHEERKKGGKEKRERRGKGEWEGKNFSRHESRSSRYCVNDKEDGLQGRSVVTRSAKAGPNLLPGLLRLDQILKSRFLINLLEKVSDRFPGIMWLPV